MSKKNEQTMQKPVDKSLEKKPVQVEVLELDETTLDTISGGKGVTNNGCNNNCLA